MVEGGIEVHQNVRVETLYLNAVQGFVPDTCRLLAYPVEIPTGQLDRHVLFRAFRVDGGDGDFCVKRLVFGRELVMQLQILSRVEAQEEGIRPQLSADVLVNSFDRSEKMMR